MPFAITTKLWFEASHQLRLYDGSVESLHGHRWQVKLTVAAAALDSIGVVMDFHDLTHRLEAVILPLRGRCLNELAPFRQENPSAENVAVHIAQTLQLPILVTLQSVEVWETPENSALYQPEI